MFVLAFWAFTLTVISAHFSFLLILHLLAHICLLEAFSDYIFWSSAPRDSPWLLSPSSQPIILYSSLSLQKFASLLPSFKFKYNYKRGTSLFCSLLYLASLSICWMNEWKSSRKWLGACHWPTGGSRLGSHRKYIWQVPWLPLEKRRQGKLRSKLEKRKGVGGEK